MGSPTSVFDLSAFQRDLLYVLAGLDRPSGQTVSRTLTEEMAHVGHGQLYSNLDVLVEYGLVEKGAKNQRANFYELTDAGADLLRARREWEDRYLSSLSAVEVCQG